MTYAVATDGPPPRDDRGVGVSDRFQRSRIPALPTVLFADASEDYRAMARDASVTFILARSPPWSMASATHEER